jgi:16S rRNA (uracil1498-N3)-methyltransferase
VRLTRVFFDGALDPGGTVELSQDSAAHLAKVLRARSGDELVLFNGNGCEFDGAVETVRGVRVSASIGAARSIDRESPFPMTLVQCVPRGDRMDFIVQKATELGIARIVPVLSQRSVVRLDAGQSAAKQAHWRAVAVSACEQCGRNRLPIVELPRALLSHLGAMPRTAAPGFHRLVLEPERGRQAQGGADPPIELDGAPPAVGAEIAVGPEGGFSPAELEAFELSAFSRMSLGPRVLRTETAAIAAIVVLQARFGDMSAVSDGVARHRLLMSPET